MEFVLETPQKSEFILEKMPDEFIFEGQADGFVSEGEQHQQKDSYLSDVVKTAKKDVMSGLEVAHAVTSPALEFASQVPIGIAGLARTISTGSFEEGAKSIQQMQEYIHPLFQHEYQTETGKEAKFFIDKLFEYLGRVGGYAGQKGIEATGSPAVGAAAETLTVLSPVLVGAVRKAPIVKYQDAVAKGKPITPKMVREYESEVQRTVRRVKEKLVNEDIKRINQLEGEEKVQARAELLSVLKERKKKHEFYDEWANRILERVEQEEAYETATTEQIGRVPEEEFRQYKYDKHEVKRLEKLESGYPKNKEEFVFEKPKPTEPKAKEPWEGFPLRKDIGESPTVKDIPPQKTGDGNIIVYHGTSRSNAVNIIKNKTILADDIGSVGIGTIPRAVNEYATAKGEPTTLEIVLDKGWLSKQEIRHEVGGYGHSAFTIQPDYKAGKKASIPPEAIKSIRVVNSKGEVLKDYPDLKAKEPWEMTRETDSSKNYNYKTTGHEGKILGKTHEFTTRDQSHISEVIDDIKQLVTDKEYQKYYDLQEDTATHDNFKNVYTNIVHNHEPISEYFGRGSSSVGKSGAKIWWYSPEKSIKATQGTVGIAGATPPASLAHEILHTLGSTKEFADPLSEAVALRFYLKHPEYVSHEWLKYNIESVIGDSLRMKGKIYKKLLNDVYSANSEYIDNIIRTRLSDTDQLKVRSFIKTKALSEGKPVPPEVLKDYPDLKAKGTTLSFLGTQGVYEQALKEVPRFKKIAQQTHDLIDVEAPWKRIGKPETGHAIKNLYSIRAMHEEAGLDYARSVAKKVNYDKVDMTDVALYAEIENPKYRSAEERARLHESVQDVNKYFDEYQKKYAEHGIVVDFKARIIEEIEALLKEELEHSEDYIELQKALKAAENMRFVHIPAAQWFSDVLVKDPAGAKRTLSLLISQKRKNLTLQSLIEQGKVNPEDINIVDIIASYSRRAGKDFALLEVVKAAEKEGLAVKGKAEGFVDPPFTAGILKKYKLHPALADWVWEMTRKDYDAMNLWEKFLSITKMTQFYNPLFLPMYDMVQATMLGSTRSIKTPKYAWQAIKDIYLKTPEYWEALENGLASKPFNNPLSSYLRMAENMKSSPTGVIARRTLESITPKGLVTFKWLQNSYNASWWLAWELDKTVRMMSYRYLKDKGYSPREAAQLAAKFHSDYASVPPKTRKVLNHILFTPTFKITMGKLYVQMINNAIKAGGGRALVDMMRKVEGQELLGKMTPKQKHYAKGLLATIAICEAFDLFMLSQGFERDEWGRRYVKQVETDDGTEELVFTWSAPANMFHKYLYRVRGAFRTGEPHPWQKLFETNKWEIHPVYRTAYDVLWKNDDGRGNPIYDPDDDDIIKVFKGTEYAVRNIISMLGMMDTTAMDVKARDKFAEETNRLLDILTRPFAFKYIRSDKDKRILMRLRSLRKEYLLRRKKEAYRAHREGEEYETNETRLQNFLKKIQELRQELED